MMESAGDNLKKILILIEDGSFLFDNRVRREARTLTSAGYRVLVICPRYPGESSFEVHDNVHVYRYKKWEFGGHLGEYFSSLIKGGWLSLKVWRRHKGFDCIQACNPPDLWFILAFFYKFFRGVPFVFDHHDVCPELYLSRFGGTENSLGYRIMLVLEKLTFRLADGVISTNESYKKIAMTRGGIAADHVRVVRNGPDMEKFRVRLPDPQIKKSGRIVVGYLGNMNPQDGVDHLLMAAKLIIHDRGRKDLYFIFVGKGDAFDGLVHQKTALELDDYVYFTGRVPDDEMLRYLCSCDICVQPDPRNPLNDISTMNKVMEYMALEKPVVAYDLLETHISGGDCALYAIPDRVEDLADKIMKLADNEAMRSDMGKKGRKRVEDLLEWKHSEKNLVDLYKIVFAESDSTPSRPPPGPLRKSASWKA